MTPGPRNYKQASLRVAIPEGLPDEYHDGIRELVSVLSEQRGNGDATALMHSVCAEADMARKVLLLLVRPFADGMDEERLCKFYEKHGFQVVQEEPCLMARQPQPSKIVRIH